MRRQRFSSVQVSEREETGSRECAEQTGTAREPDFMSKSLMTRGDFTEAHITRDCVKERIINPLGMTSNHQDSRTRRECKETSVDNGEQEDEKFVDSSQKELLSAYEQQCQAARAAVGALCADLVHKSFIPPLIEPEAPLSPSEFVEDAQQRTRILQEFNKAVEGLQTGNIPTKRRGNLPKECISHLKTWCYEHYDNPYPSDPQKLEMSRRTQVDVNQISHWFINYRKRVWKPNLPVDHPAFKEKTKKARR